MVSKGGAGCVWWSLSGERERCDAGVRQAEG